MKKNIKTKADNFAEALKDNPKEIIAWARAEIREYEKLIKMLEKRLLDNKKR